MPEAGEGINETPMSVSNPLTRRCRATVSLQERALRRVPVMTVYLILVSAMAIACVPLILALAFRSRDKARERN